MSRKQKILVVVFGLLLVLGLGYWAFLRPAIGPTEMPKTNTNKSQQSISLPSTSTTVTAIVPEATPEDTLKSDLVRMAAAFAERFGSYSNQGNFENLLDLKSMETSDMQTWTDNYVNKNEAANTNSAYSGVTTKAISTNISSLDETVGTATVVVGTQRRESSGSMADNSTINYQNLELVFKKVSGDWKVDAATWE